MGRLNTDSLGRAQGAVARVQRTIQDEVLSGRIILDDTTFDHCSFQHAVLVYRGGAPPTLKNCSFEATAFEFEDAASRTLALLQAMSSTSSGLRDVFKASFPRVFGH
ncbi:hypothetical protein [Phenylobacterium sp.]|uniref:hypothetical protein n=1 Tax=Phenylobacterium sp. TaxID=1871053 RepID=UPI003564AD43